jgi:hypothetical protein
MVLRQLTRDIQPRERTKARAKLAIDGIPPFSALYGRFVSNKLPARAALIDAAKEVGVPEGMQEECVDTFIVNQLEGFNQNARFHDLRVEAMPSSRPSMRILIRRASMSHQSVKTVARCGSMLTCFSDR